MMMDKYYKMFNGAVAEYRREVRDIAKRKNNPRRVQVEADRLISYVHALLETIDNDLNIGATPHPPTEPGVYWAGRTNVPGEEFIWVIGEVYQNSEDRWFIWLVKDPSPIAIDGLAKDIVWQGPMKEPS